MGLSQVRFVGHFQWSDGHAQGSWVISPGVLGEMPIQANPETLAPQVQLIPYFSIR